MVVGECNGEPGCRYVDALADLWSSESPNILMISLAEELQAAPQPKRKSDCRFYGTKNGRIPNQFPPAPASRVPNNRIAVIACHNFQFCGRLSWQQAIPITRFVFSFPHVLIIPFFRLPSRRSLPLPPPSIHIYQGRQTSRARMSSPATADWSGRSWWTDPRCYSHPADNNNDIHLSPSNPRSAHSTPCLCTSIQYCPQTGSCSSKQ